MDFIFRAITKWFCGGPATDEPKHEQPYVPPQPQPPLSYPPAHPPSRPQQPPAHIPSPPPRKDQNVQNAHYVSLRQRARDAGAQMAQAFEASHTAYARGEGARAKELSNEGKAHQREMERLNAQASEWIYVENNKDRQPGEIDLHGLFVKEAITYSEHAIKEARQGGNSRVNLIVGKGLHSTNGNAKLRPAIAELMQKEGLVAELDPNNAGVLIVNLDGRPSGVGNVVRPDDIARGIESKNGDCIIM
ncbi:hypothetical protein B0H21DRAFT_820534 [Amylocystis lapponica]|nr:hypothetical protein B0H21DRAFT_820534 [Amylocystis lapponica]